MVMKVEIQAAWQVGETLVVEMEEAREVGVMAASEVGERAAVEGKVACTVGVMAGKPRWKRGRVCLGQHQESDQAGLK